MPIIGIYGGISAGKTLVQTYMLVKEWRKYQKPILSNYHLKQIPFTYLQFKDLLALSDARIDLTNCTIGLDELQNWVDSRTAAKKLNRLFTYFVLQTGKDDINMYYTTQDPGQVDLRVRQRTDIWVYVERRGNLHLCMINDKTQMRRKRTRMVIRGEYVYQFYDTREKIKPAEIEPRAVA